MTTPLKMTPRQAEVLALAGAGETDAEIAKTLGIMESTARMHVAEVRTRILIAYPQLKSGRPRPVILRYFRMVESLAYRNGGSDADAHP